MNSMALKSITADAGLLSPRRAAGAYLTEMRYEFTRVLRNPAMVLPIVLVPLALYALFALLIAGEAITKDPVVGTYVFAGMSVMAVTMPCLFGIGASLAMEREMGLMRLKRAQPAPMGSWLIAKITCGMAFSMLAYLPILAVALVTGKLTLGTGEVIAMSATLLAGAVPYCALGLMIGTLASGSAAPGFAILLYLPGCYLSGMFFPLPESMSWEKPIWPQFHIDQLAMHAAGVTKYPLFPAQLSIAMLLGFTVLFSGIAVWRLARKG